MKQAPRASLTITILGDEDYRVLLSTRGGLEAFGAFVALLLVGRERYGQGKARRLSETDSLILDNSQRHISALTNISPRQLANALCVFSRVARETGGEPWVYADEQSHLVIRSFFKFNTGSGWGGPRKGSGRKSSRNQDDSFRNQVESSSESSWGASGSGAGLGINPPTPPPSAPPVPPADSCGDEPFVPPPGLPAPEAAPAVVNDPAEVERVADLAERLFPVLDFGPKVRTYCRLYPAHWLRAALERADAKKIRRWDYVLGVLNGFASRPDSAPPKPRPAPSAPVYHRAERPRRYRGEAAPETNPNPAPGTEGVQP